MTRAANLLPLLVALAGAPATLHAQGPGAASPRAQPRVDPLTASIQGRVTAADTGAPIRRAEVRATTDGGVNRLVMTDANGRYELRDMPAGQFRLAVTKSGFVPMNYGQRRPFEATRQIRLAAGQRVVANIALPRGGAITGRVYDEAGEPLADVRVQALRPRMLEGRRRLQPVGPVDVTDDTGAYRVYGLAPGDYYVSASPPRRDTLMPMGAALAPAVHTDAMKATVTTFHPGTPSSEEALRVTVGVSGEARADIQLGTVQAPSVSGIVLDSSGAPAVDATVSLRSETVSMGVSAVLSGPPPVMISGHTAADGTFSLPGVPPGPYSLQAVGFDAPQVMTREQRNEVPPMQTAVVPLTVAGADIAGLTVTLGRGGMIEGTFVPDSGVTRPLPTGLEVRVRSASAAGPMMMNRSASYNFRVWGVNAVGHLDVEGLPEGWAVKRVLVDGADVADQPIDMRNGRSMTARIVLTDRVTELTGTVTGIPQPADDDPQAYTVVIFPQDAAKWVYPSRHLRTVRTTTDGAFRVTALPGDERYLAAAVDYLEDGEGTDPDFLERIRDQATSVSLADAERKSIELRLIRR